MCVHGDNPGKDRSEMAVHASRLRGEGEECSEGSGGESWAGVRALPLFTAGTWA